MSIFTPEELAQLDGLAGSMPAKKQAQQVAPLEVQADDTDVLMHALMGTEGSGPSAVSPKGATGRMQIMPDTFKDYAESGESYDNEAHRVSAARRKIASDLKWANGDPALAAAAYFAGRGGAQAWANGKSDPHDGNINTTEYVRRTLAKMGIDPDQSDALVRRLSGGKGQTQQALEDDYSSHSGAFNNGARIASDAIVAEERAKAPTAGDYLKAVQSSAVRGIGDMGRGLIGEPAAWLMNKATGTEDYEGKNLLDEAAQSYKDSMTPGGQRASAEHATGDVFDPSTWKLPDSAAGTAMMFADGIGSLASTVIPMVGIAARAQKLNKMAQIAIQSGKAAEGAALLVKARDAERLAKIAGVTTGFGTTGGAAAGEVRKNVEATIAKQDHATLYSEVPEYRRVFDRTGDEQTARTAVVNYAAQASNLLAGAFGAVGGYANAKILEDILMKRGISAALGKMTDSRIVRAGVGGLGGAVAEGMQETSEKVGQNMGENIGLGRPATADVSRDSFGDALGGAMVGGAMGAGGGAFSSAPARPAPQPNSPLTNAANAGTPPVSPTVPPAGTDAAAPDPFAQRLSQVQFRLEDPALLTTIRNTQGLGPESVTELLGAWSTARNPNTDPRIRERAMASVEAFLAQLDSRPDFTTHAPYEAGLPAVPQSANPNPGAGPGTDLTSPNDGPGPVMPHMGTGNVYDGEFSQEPDAALPRPALPAPGGISPEQRGDVRNRIASGFIRFDNNGLLNPSTGERYDLPTMALRQFARNHLKQALLAAPTDVAAHDAAASQTNRRDEPTAGQKEAGNYKKGHIKVGGLDISVENPQGSARTGVDQDGETWSTIMGAHYGYVKRTTGNDGDQLDVFVKPGTPEDWNGNAFVIDQIDPKTGKFDEHKTMLGYDSEAEARAAYQANYDPSWRGLGAITAMPLQDFKTWARNEDTTKPVGKIQTKTSKQAIAPEDAIRILADAYGDQNVIDGVVGGDFAGVGRLNMDDNGNVILTRHSGNEEGITKSGMSMTPAELRDYADNGAGFGGASVNTSGLEYWGDNAWAGGDNFVGTFTVPLQELADMLRRNEAVIANLSEGEISLLPSVAERYLTHINGQPVGNKSVPAQADEVLGNEAATEGMQSPVASEENEITGDQLATEPEDKPINPGDVSVGDTVYFTDVRDETKRIPGNFRGFNGDQVVVVWNGGQQMSLPKNRVFKNDVQTGETLATKPSQPEQTQGQAQGAEGTAEGVARTLNEEGRATDGKPINPGDVFRTLSGRNATPYPKQKGQKYASQWLIDNATAEAESRGDDFNARMFKNSKPMKDGTLTTADRDGMLMYLFSQQSDVVPSIFKPLTGETSVQVTPPADTKTDKVIDDLTIPLPKAIDLMTPGMRSLYKVDEVIASLPNLHTNVMISDIPDQRGVAYTTEKAMHQLLAHRGIIADQDGKLRSGNRTSATPGTLLANIKNYHATANDIRGSRQENPQMWADYAARQAEVQKLNVGDLVLTPYGGPEDPYGAPAIIVQKHTKNWKVQYTTGVESELLIPPSSLRPATADTKTDEVSTPSDAKDDKPALLAELREKLSALSARAMNAGVGALAGRIGGFTVGMKDDDANLTRAWVDQVVAGREKMVAVAEKNAAKSKPVAEDNIQVSEPISENQTDSNAAPVESELDQRIKALGKKARDAAEILKEGGYWRKQLYTQYRGGEKFETHLHYQNGAQVKGFGFATLTEMKDAGVLTTRDVQSSTVYPTEWVLRDQPLTQPVTTTETQNAASEATGKQTGGEAQTTETVRGSEGEGISRKGMYGPWGLEDIEAGNVALIPLTELLSANTNEDYAIVGLRRVNNALSARDASLGMSIPGMERAELPDSLYVTVNDRGASPLETESFTVDYYGKSVEIQKTQIAEQDTVFGLAPIAIDEDAGRYFAYQVGNDPQLYDFIDAVEQAFAQIVAQQSAATQDVASERTEGTTPSTIEPAPEDDAKAVDATQNATAHRETQRVLFNELSSYAPISTLSDPEKAKQVVAGILAKMAEDGEAIGGVTVDNLPADFWKAVSRRVERLVRKEELEKNRDPEIYRTALANGMVEANVGEDADMQTAFKQGWDHALSGGTASTLSGNLLGVITDGYNRAQAWIADGQGKAWFTGKRAKKLENTGPDLRRWYEQAAKTLEELDKADIQKAWKQIEDATVRSEVFNPDLSDTATPGARRWSNDIRDKILPFKEWLISVYGPLHSMYGNVWRKDSASFRVEKFLAGTGTISETYGTALEDRPQMALSILQAAAQKYLDKIHTLSTALDGAGTVAELATKFDALVNEGRNLSDFGSEFRTKYTYSTYRGYNFEPDGLATRHHQSNESEEITSTRATPLTRPKLDSIRRSGKKDYRQGKNVSPVEFQDTFKFASVGFGKWVAGKQDQNHLNYAYDAFMDLADVLGLQPENIGLGGTLHFTVGALGRGKHSAHFSPDQPSPDGTKVAVINLTNTRGDGAVAHEWLHALDWHLGGGKANGEAVAVVTNALSSVISYEELGKVPSKFIFGGWRYTQLGKKATPIDHATMAIDRGTYGRPVPTQFKKDADALGKGAEDNYWARAHELFARAGEAWVFDQLADAESNYLVSDWVADGYATKETGYRGRPYPTGEDRTRFARYFRAFFDALTWSDTGPTADYAQVHALWRAEMAEFEQAKQEMLDSLPALYEQHLAQQKAESTRRLNAEVANTEAEGARLAEEQKRREEERQRLELERALTEKNAKPDMPVSDGLSDDELEALFDEAESRVNEEQQEVAVTQPFKPARDYTGRTWKDANGDTRRVMAYQGGDTVTVGTLGKEGWVQMTPAEVERDIAAGKAAQSDSSSGRGGKVRDTPKPDSEPQTAPDSAAGLIAEAAKLGVKGIDEALTGLAKLFGSPGRLNSFPGGFDQDTYNQAKPHFEASLAAFKAAGRTLVDLFAMLLREYGSGIRPYATKFAKEQKLGRELNQEDAKNDVSTPQTESGINDRPSDAGPRTEDVPLPPSERGAVEGDSGTGGSSGGDLRGNVRPGEGQGADQQDGLPGERSSPDDGAPGSGGNRTGASDGVRVGRTGKRSGRDGVSNFNAQPGQLERTGSWRDTAARNLDIVQLVKQLDSENRMATPEEQAQLARYVGWGAGEIRNKLFPGTEDVRGSGGFKIYPTWADGAWKPLVERVMALLTPEELNTALRSTQYAHFTGESISRPIWRGIQRLGFNGGKILEPGMGTGNFPITAPAELMEASSYTGIEMDHMTAAIAKQLLPQENILQADFVKQRLPKNFFDLAAGNPPFADIRITDDPAYKKHRFLLHDYFFAKSLDSVRPGGLLVFITSSGTMDKKNDRARQFMADRADLLGAIRLPQTAFKDSAGTEVVTDILFLQKRQPGIPPAGQQWLGHANVQTKDGDVMVNEYFAAHPEMVLGEFRISGNYDEDGNRINSLNRIGQTVVVPHKGIEIGAELDRAIDSLPEGVYQATVAKDSETLRQESAERDFDPKLKKEGGVYLHDKKGTLLRVENGVGVPLSELEKFTPAQAEWMRDYVGLRDAIKNAQFDQLNDGEWEKSLAKLNKVYDKFVAKHGLIQSFTSYDKTETDEDGVERTIERRRYKNKKVLGFDVESPLVESLEKITEDGHIVKAPFLLDRTIKKPTRPVIKSLQDALMVSLDEKGTLDLAHVANLANRQEQEVIDELGDLIFESPSGGWQMGDEYLSDDVVTKLEEAEQAAAMDPRFQRNVQALILVQPKPLEASDVTLALGMRWIPPSVITRFAVEHLGMETRVTYDDIRHEWSVAGADGTGSRAARNKASEWGITGRRSDFEMLDTVLNQRDLSISETVSNGHGGTKTQKDQAATARAQKIAEDMQKAFATWVWTDVDRARNLLALYNRKYNNIAPRKFDGSHLTLPGLSLRYTLHPHQKRAVWRIIQTGNTYTAHAVGAGKSLEMIVSAMEQKRLGLINKPLFVVPNHMLEQMSNEFMDAYPMANIMVADEENFHTSNRRRFIAQAALNNPDAIIITHAAFAKLSVKPETAQRVVDKLVAEMAVILQDMPDGTVAEKKHRKQIEKRIEDMERRFLGKADDGTKDQVLNFEDLGVDFLYMDEAHEFRRLEYATNRGQVKGISPDGSVRALDLYIKTRWLEQQRPGRSMVLASGTPVTNTMAELFSIMRYLDEEALENDDISRFDEWAAMFGEVKGNFERDASGVYQFVDRFAKFKNVPELMKRVRRFMDVLTMSQLGGLVQRPDISTGQPQMVVGEETEQSRIYRTTTLASRLESSKAWKPSPSEPNNPDPIINIITDGRLAAIDPRYVLPHAKNDPTSKLNVMIDGVIKSYQDNKNNVYLDPVTGKPEPIKGATHLVFSSVGFGEQVQANRGFDVRGHMMRRFKEAGIPAAEVAFRADFASHAKKEALFKDMRSGKIKILIGSPKNMGTGLNVQRRLKSLHFMSPPWYPADVEQPHGRILRQGNQNAEADIYWYSTKGTYDSTMWNMVARKSRFIEQAFSGDDSVRTIDDISESSQYEMASALSAGDERAIQLAGYTADIERLERLREAHFKEQSELHWRKSSTEHAVQYTAKNIEKIKKAISDRPENYWTLKVDFDGVELVKPSEIGERLLKDMDAALAAWDEKTKDKQTQFVMGKAFGKNPIIAKMKTVDHYKNGLSKYGTISLRLGDMDFDLNDEWASQFQAVFDATGFGRRVSSAMSAPDRALTAAENRLDEETANLKQINAKLGTPFSGERELDELVSEKAQLELAMAEEGKAQQAAQQPAAAIPDDAMSRNDAGTSGMPIDDVRAFVEVLASKWSNAGRIHVYARPEDLGRMGEREQAILTKIEEAGALREVNGYYSDGDIYLFADHLDGLQDVQKVLLHEATHMGLSGMFGRGLDAVMISLYQGNRAIHSEANKIMGRYDGMTRVKAVYEVLAEMGGDGIEASVWDRLVAFVRGWLRRAGMDLTISDAEIRSLVTKALSYARNTPSAGAAFGASAMSRAGDTITVDGKERSRLNSNGNPIAQTEEGLRNFWKWFEDSAVVDADGNPLVVYHGTPNDFSVFGKEFQKDGDIGRGFYFTDSKKLASDWSRNGVVMPVYLSGRTGLDMLKAGLPVNSADLVVDEWRGAKMFKVFRPEQIKSAIGNAGTFGSTDTDILKNAAFDEDMESQSSWMQSKAKERGFKDVDELFAKKPQALIALAEQWRQDHPAAVETVAHKIEEPANPGRRNFIKQTTALVAWSYAGKSFSQPAGLKEMLRAGDLPAAIAWLAQNASNKDSRTLAKKLAPLMAGIDLQVIKVGQEYHEGFPAALASSYGVTSVNNKTGKVRIFLREPKSSDGLNGLTEETVLHEALHAAILNRYGALSRRGAKVLYGNAAKMLPGDDAILRIVKLWQEYGTYLAQKGLNTGKSPAWMTEPYKSVDELITYALTNPEFQAWMKKTEFNKQGAWRRFVSAVRSFLGLDGSPPDTYLGAIMDATYSMLDAAKQVKQGAFLQASSNSVDVFSHAGDSRIRDIMGDARIDTSLWGPGFANLPPDTPADGMRQHANTVPEGWIRPLTDRVSRMFRNTDKFNWRDTSIHSQLHKAAKNPYFAETFSRVQQFMNDASRAALRPSELAPTVLPRIDVVSSIMPAIRGLLKGKEAAADIDAAHLAVLRGTLSDTIYDDAEQAGLTEAQFGIYREFRDAIDASLEELAAGEAWKMASTLFSPEEQSDKMTMKTAIINSPESAENTLRDMLAERRAEIALRMQAAEDTGRAVNPDDQAAMDRIDDVSERLDKIFERVAQLKNDGYAPLMRFGQYSLHLYRIDPMTGRQEEDENGEKVSEYFGLFESESERDTALKTMREEYAGDQGMQFEHGTVSKEQWKLYRGVSPETVALFAEAIGIEKDDVFQEWYRKAASNRSALKRLIHRKGTPGFSTDGARVLSSFVTSNGRRAAQQYHMGDILESVEAFPKGQGIEQDEAVKMIDYIQDPQEEMGALRSFMFFHYLGGTLSNFFINSTQPAMMTLPYLARDVGMKEAMRVLKDAYRFAWKNDGMSPELANALSDAEDAGVVAAQQIHHLWNETARPLVNKLGRFGENAAYRAHSFMQLWGMPFALAEHMNRRVTFIAAYNAAKNRGLGSDAAYEAAVDAVNETQIIYDKSNRPNWARGNIGSLIFTFKLFSISYVELATRLMRSGTDGKWAAVYMLGLLLLASGLQGMPGSDDLDDLLDTIAQLMGYNVSTTAAKRKWLENLAGEEAGRMLMYGISTLTPLDLHSRLGMGNLLPATAMFKPSNDRKFEDALEIIGPAGGLMRSYIDATEAIETGNLSKASEAMLPKFFRDMKQGIEAGINGEYRDRNGRKVDDVSAAEAFVKSIGFQPQSISMQGKIGWQVQQRVAFARKRETAIVSEWARRIVDGDPGAAAIAFSQRDEWNQQNPDTPIAIKRSQAARRVKEMRADKNERLLKSVPRELKEMAQEEME